MFVSKRVSVSAAPSASTSTPGSSLSFPTALSPSSHHSHAEKRRIRASSPLTPTPPPSMSRSQSSRASAMLSPSLSRNSSLRPSVSFSNVSQDNIRVYCRIRPLNGKELKMGGEECIRVSECGTEVDIVTPNEHYGPVAERFAFAKVFGPLSAQEDVFRVTALPLIANVFAGYNATILAYGQTGRYSSSLNCFTATDLILPSQSGKTHTMTGDAADVALMGIIPRAAGALFDRAYNFKDGIDYKFTVTFIEIYNEQIRDLLNEGDKKGPLVIREGVGGEFFVSEVEERSIASSDELLRLMGRGNRLRSTGATNMNEASSRSHSVFTVNLVQENSARDVTIMSKLVLVDLAGSEMVKKSGAEGGMLKEAAAINVSLSALGAVINALSTKGSKHIPFRNSALTKLLRTSLG